MILFILSVLLVLPAWDLLAIEWDDSKFMRLDEVKVGMRGKGKTVFSGTTVEEFDIEVISIQRNFYPQWDVIWARGSGKNFGYTGVAGGMSGSPCYINGRLIGALSLGYSFQKYGDMFGITPIEQMIQVTKRSMTPKIAYSGGTNNSFEIPAVAGTQNSSTSTPWSQRETEKDTAAQSFSMGNIIEETLMPNFEHKTGRQENRLADAFFEPRGFNPYYNSNYNPNLMSPQIQIPVAISGINPRAISLLQPFFDRYGLYPVQGGGGGSINVDVPLEPGQAVGIEYARGDVTLFAYGTITYIEGNQILAFGHGMFGEGNVSLPLTTGYVHYINPSLARSFKVASPAKTIGTLVQDRTTAIAGLLGSAPSFIPVHLHLKTGDGIEKDLHYEVMRHRDLSALIVMIGAYYLMSGVDRDSGDYTVQASSVISIKDRAPIKKENIYSGNFLGEAPFQLLAPLSFLISNPFQNVELEKIDLNFTFEDKRKAANLESVRINKNLVKPGEEVELQISLAPYLGKPVLKTHRLQIPADIPEGNYMLIISSALAARAFEISRAPFLFQPKNFDQLLEIIQMSDRSDEIIVELFSPKFGLAVSGSELPNLPLSVLSVMNSPKQSGERGITRGVKLLKDKILTEYVVSGQQILQIRVSENAK